MQPMTRTTAAFAVLALLGASPLSHAMDAAPLSAVQAQNQINRTTLPATLAPLLRLLIMGPLLAAIWYLLLRLLRHELVDELHRLAQPIRNRLALLLPNS